MHSDLKGKGMKINPFTDYYKSVFQNRGSCGQALPSFPSPSPVIPFFCSRLNVPDELALKRLLRRLEYYYTKRGQL